ncbi:unnamed protein product [Allacma fusca]|uniref:Uncharacterized protein n=1 Tax=Allacma fusca TaxID=39272 RepID=A0A8J2JLD4_9HEXA|nr:unnamed protein product [Allacma fusca]
MSDLENDPIVMFHERYYDIFHLACVFIIPTLIPCAAHLWGYRPYDTSMSSAENKLVAFLAVGWAYDLKSAAKDAVGKRVGRTGNHLHLQNDSPNIRVFITLISKEFADEAPSTHGTTIEYIPDKFDCDNFTHNRYTMAKWDKYAFTP